MTYENARKIIEDMVTCMATIISWMFVAYYAIKGNYYAALFLGIIGTIIATVSIFKCIWWIVRFRYEYAEERKEEENDGV